MELQTANLVVVAVVVVEEVCQSLQQMVLSPAAMRTHLFAEDPVNSKSVELEEVERMSIVELVVSALLYTE